jgi:peptide deformylase
MQIRLFPDPVLRKPTELVTVFDGNLRGVIQSMDKVMRDQPSGIGIAAPQVGICKQIALVDVSSRVPSAKPLVLINPRILEMREERISREGCMSLPDYTGQLKRYNRIRVSYQDEQGNLHIKAFRDIEAICIQHEVDHLNGKLFIDHVASLKRDMIPRPKRSKRV